MGKRKKRRKNLEFCEIARSAKKREAKRLFKRIEHRKQEKEKRTRQDEETIFSKKMRNISLKKFFSIGLMILIS